MIVLVIGGTGTLGQVLVPKLFGSFGAKRVRILSRDEHKQIHMNDRLNEPRIDYFIGDVRDRDRVWLAAKGCEMIFNLAAIKSVDKAEYSPMEAIATNVTGTTNVVDACLKHQIPSAVYISTDKAVEPLNIYGASKLCAEKLFINSNAYSGENGPKFSCMRYGNVLGSNGSVIPKWVSAVARGLKPKLSDPEMTRFWISKESAANFVIDRAKSMTGAEIFIPKMKSCTMKDLYAAFCEVVNYTGEVEIIGNRGGEKKFEALFGLQECDFVTQTQDRFVSWPTNPNYPIQIYGQPVTHQLTSHNAERFSKTELKEMIAGVIQ